MRVGRQNGPYPRRRCWDEVVEIYRWVLRWHGGSVVIVKLRDAAPTSRVMVVAIMVSMVAFLDSTVVNLALPATTRDLGGGMDLQQWVVDGYLLALGTTI